MWHCCLSVKSIQWWSYDIDTLSPVLALCGDNPPMPVGFPSQITSNARLEYFSTKFVWDPLNAWRVLQMLSHPACDVKSALKTWKTYHQISFPASTKLSDRRLCNMNPRFSVMLDTVVSGFIVSDYCIQYEIGDYVFALLKQIAAPTSC